MAKIETMGMSRDIKVNLGNYESTSVSVWLTISLQEGDDRHEVQQHMDCVLSKTLREELAEIDANRDPKEFGL